MAHAIMGIVIGIIAFFMDKLEDSLVTYNRKAAQAIIDAVGQDSATAIWLPWV